MSRDVLAGRSCPKCGSDDLACAYHENNNRCRMRDVCRQAGENEHLRVNCRRCQWAQVEPVLDGRGDTEPPLP